MKERKIDRVLFFSAVVIVLAVSAPLILMAEQAEPFVSELYNWIAANFGVFYQLFGLSTMVFLAWLVFGPYGQIRLGGDRPDFSNFSWAGHLKQE